MWFSVSTLVPSINIIYSHDITIASRNHNPKLCQCFQYLVSPLKKANPRQVASAGCVVSLLLEKSIDLPQPTDELDLIKLYEVHLANNRNQIHNLSGDRH